MLTPQQKIAIQQQGAKDFAAAEAEDFNWGLSESTITSGYDLDSDAETNDRIGELTAMVTSVEAAIKDEGTTPATVALRIALLRLQARAAADAAGEFANDDNAGDFADRADEAVALANDAVIAVGNRITLPLLPDWRVKAAVAGK